MANTPTPQDAARASLLAFLRDCVTAALLTLASATELRVVEALWSGEE